MKADDTDFEQKKTKETKEEQRWRKFVKRKEMVRLYFVFFTDGGGGE
jgi:hypothetical protein